MNKLFFSLISIFVFTSCASEYKIEGSSSVSRLDGKMLFVKVPKGDSMVNIDSAEVVHGIFKMEGVVDSTVFASLFMDDESIMPFVIEKGNININIDNARLLVSGTPLNDKLYTFITKKNAIDDMVYEVSRLESHMIMDGHDPEEIAREVNTRHEKLVHDMDKLTKDFIKNNYNNVLGPAIFILICNNYQYPVLNPYLEDIIKDAPDSFKNIPYIKEYISAAKMNMDNIRD